MWCKQNLQLCVSLGKRLHFLILQDQKISPKKALSRRSLRTSGEKLGPEGPARHLDASRQKVTPPCLAAILTRKKPSPKVSLKMPPKLPLPRKRGHLCLFQNYPRGEGNSENSRRLWLFLGSAREFPRKTPGKSRENCWKMFPESRNATNSRILGTKKGKPAGNLGSTLPGPCTHLPCGKFFEIDSSSLLELF